MEKSIATLKNSTTKNQQKTKMNIAKRRHDNNRLIRDLEGVRKSKNKLEHSLEKKQLTIQKLKLEKQKIQREFDKKLSQIEQETLERVKQVGLMGTQGKESQN